MNPQIIQQHFITVMVLISCAFAMGIFATREDDIFWFMFYLICTGMLGFILVTK